jgi:leucine dehydrogenase
MSWDSIEAERCIVWRHRPSGLRAVAVVDQLVDGLAAGGIRTVPCAHMTEAVTTAALLARAMTTKCALASLPVGGCKIVVDDHPALQRVEAFGQLGRYLAELGGMIRTAGDLGTGGDDLRAAAAEAPEYVHVEEGRLADAVARGVWRCVQAWLRFRGESDEIAGRRMALQGCGAVGSAVARCLAQHGAELLVSDVVEARAARLAEELGATAVAPEACLLAEVDVLLPCAVGGVVDARVANTMRARALIGAANNVLAGDEAAEVLMRRGIDVVPDVIASAGAVVDGIGRSVLGRDDTSALLDRLGDTAAEVLRRAAERGRPPGAVAEALASERRGAPAALPGAG